MTLLRPGMVAVYMLANAGEVPCPPCPDCRSRRALQIIYGLPSAELYAAARDKEIVLGGWSVGESGPEWSCQLCGRQFTTEDIGLL